MRKQQLRMACGGEVACDKKDVVHTTDPIGPLVDIDCAAALPDPAAKNIGVWRVSLMFCWAFSQCLSQSARESTSGTLELSSHPPLISTDASCAMNCIGHA